MKTRSFNLGHVHKSGTKHKVQGPQGGIVKGKVVDFYIVTQGFKYDMKSVENIQIFTILARSYIPSFYSLQKRYFLHTPSETIDVFSIVLKKSLYKFLKSNV